MINFYSNLKKISHYLQGVETENKSPSIITSISKTTFFLFDFKKKSVQSLNSIMYGYSIKSSRISCFSRENSISFSTMKLKISSIIKESKKSFICYLVLSSLEDKYLLTLLKNLNFHNSTVSLNVLFNNNIFSFNYTIVFFNILI